MENKKKILITGTSSGIGRAVTENFLSDGYEVHGISRTKNISDLNYKHYYLDLNDQKKILSLSNKLSEIKFNTFIHNAGIHGPIGKFEECNLDEWFKAFQINLFSGITLLKIILQNLKDVNGCVIFIAGGGSANSMKNFSSYSCSKTSIVRFCENFAEEYPNIRCHCVSPGPNKTKLLKEAMNNGINVDESRIVDFNYTYKLCSFLMNNNSYNLSGRQIHVKDDYKLINSSKISNDEYKLRRFIHEKN